MVKFKQHRSAPRAMLKFATWRETFILFPASPANVGKGSLRGLM